MRLCVPSIARQVSGYWSSEILSNDFYGCTIDGGHDLREDWGAAEFDTESIQAALGICSSCCSCFELKRLSRSRLLCTQILIFMLPRRDLLLPRVIVLLCRVVRPSFIDIDSLLTCRVILQEVIAKWKSFDRTRSRSRFFFDKEGISIVSFY